MKKILFSVFLIAILFFSPSVVLTSEIDEENRGIMIEERAGSINKVEYQLPYPGLLPGSPLYPVKKLRDKIIEIFLTDPERKSEFYLLQADKNLAAAIILFDRGSEDLAESTISKGENYLEKSLSKAIQAKREQKPTDSIIDRLRVSALKHQEVIEGMIIGSRGDTRERLENNLERVREFKEKVDEIKPQS